MTSVALAFLRRDLLIWASYRLAVVSQVFGVLVMIGIVYFIGRVVDADAELLEKYGGDYVAFLLSGFALTDLFNRGLSSLPQTIRENQENGTLEPMLVAPLRLMEFVTASSVFKFVLSLVRATMMLLFGALVLGFWHSTNLISVLMVLIPGALAVFSLGILFAAFVVLIKRADPVIAAYGAMAAILGGMLFPVEALPIWVRPLSWFVPLSHSLAGIRLGLQGEPPSAVAPQAAALLLLAALLLPISIVSFNWAMNRAKKEGSLVQY